MDLDAYRSSAEAFTAELDLEYYRHFAGITETFELEPIYARHASLFTTAAADALRARLDSAPEGSEERRRLMVLVDFALEGILGQSTKGLEEALAEREASLTIELGGEELGFRQAAVALATEPDAGRRGAIHSARMAAIDGSLNPLYRELTEVRQTHSRELGFASYRELCAVTKRLDLSGLHARTEAFRAASEAAFPAIIAAQVALTPGLSGSLRRADVARLNRAPQLDEVFPGDALLPAFRTTLTGLGIDPDAQPGVVYDVEARPNKSPRAFCVPVRPPDEVYLVIAQNGGWDDWGALLHEGGHTEHYAHVGRDLAFEYRLLGDNAVTECFAFLLQHLLENPRWLEQIAGISAPGQVESVVALARAQKLLLLRRYVAKLSYELELHTGSESFTHYAARYAELLGAAQGMPWDRESYLADVDDGYYCACYLRAWALESHLRAHLVREHGEAWFTRPAAGAELKRLWSQGQRLAAEELLAEVTGETLDFGLLLADVGIS